MDSACKSALSVVLAAMVVGCAASARLSPPYDRYVGETVRIEHADHSRHEGVLLLADTAGLVIHQVQTPAEGTIRIPQDSIVDVKRVAGGRTDTPTVLNAALLGVVISVLVLFVSATWGL